MKEKNTDNSSKRKIISALGGILALVFYAVSCIVVMRNNAAAELENTDISGDLKVITIAHWQLEDGFREGINYAIKEFEKLKAAQGQKVKVIQNAIPSRGFSQWYITQLISGNPADIIELTTSPEIQSRYFLPLSTYISKPNPFNKGTPCENIPWKDSFNDGLDGSLNPIFAEYFGVGVFRHCQRIYVNMDLLKAATGSEKTPESFEELLECCQKVEEYAQKIKKPIIPMGVRGIDKSTVGTLYSRFNNQINTHYNDLLTYYGDGTLPKADIFTAFGEGKLDIDRLLVPAELVKNIGKYFSDGFTTTDSQQTKYLFFTGNVCFFMEGSWDAWTMVNNTPFNVKIIRVPTISSDGKYGKYFVGKTLESAFSVSGKFGITKDSRHRELALEFLQFLTSWEINQKTMMEFCKWPGSIKNIPYTGFLEAMKPDDGDARRSIQSPLMFNSKSRIQILECLENIIIEQPENTKLEFAKGALKNIPVLKEEFKNVVSDLERQLFDMEGNRTCISAKLLQSDLTGNKRENQEIRSLMAAESLVARELERQQSIAAYNAMDHIKPQLENYISKNEKRGE